MNKKIFNIVLILVIIIMMPAVFFSVYEFSSLRKNEKVITDIYNNQLETILNSVNQYSNDITQSWAEEINRFSYSVNSQKKEIQDLLALNNPIEYIFITDTSGAELTDFARPGSVTACFHHDTLKQIIQKNREQILRLLSFMETGYRKIEPVKTNSMDDLALFMFILGKQDYQKKICGIFIDPGRFMREVLSPRIQSSTEDRFIITAYRGSDEIYSSDIYTEKKRSELKKPVWMIPGYYLGIQMKDQTIEDLVGRRSRTNIMLTLAMDLLLIGGAWFLYKNVRKEMQLAQIKSDFVSSVSHEIRTPLSLINMFIETLEMNRIKSDLQRKEYYEILGQESRRLAGIVNKILNFSKIESGKKSYRFETIHLNTVVENVLNVYKYHLESEKFAYTFSPGTGLPEIQADAEAVSDALINLIDNAVKYSPDTKEIHIRTGFGNGYVYIEIEDKGMGIPENAQKLVFDKFYRVAEGSLAYTGKGTGLGLSIVKHTMDAHKGKIRLESIPGKGTTFKLSFPVKSRA